MQTNYAKTHESIFDCNNNVKQHRRSDVLSFRQCKGMHKKKDGVPYPSLRQISVKNPSVGSPFRHSAVKISLSRTLQNFSHKSSNGLLSIS
jgi:hypothetical protein